MCFLYYQVVSTTFSIKEGDARRKKWDAKLHEGGKFARRSKGVAESLLSQKVLNLNGQVSIQNMVLQ